MPYLVLLPTILLSLFLHTSEVIVDIVSSVDSRCTTSCFTLMDFAARHGSENDIVDGTILRLGSGNHFLTSATVMNVMSINSFSMVSEMQDSSVICSQMQQAGLSFNFANIKMVKIVNISFIDCERSDSAMLEFDSVHDMTINECNFINSKGNIVFAYQSKITITRTVFMNSSSNDGITLFNESLIAIDASNFTDNKPSNFDLEYCMLSIIPH